MPSQGGLAVRKGESVSDVEYPLARETSHEMEYAEPAPRGETRDLWVLFAGVAIGWGVSTLLKGTKI